MRRSIGMALVDSLDELIQAGHINPQLALKILAQVGRC
jgi:transcription initiation factor TFIIA small subunit